MSNAGTKKWGMSGSLALLFLILISVGCTGVTTPSTNDYGPPIPVVVKSKYIAPGDGVLHANRGWVNTDVGTFEVFGPVVKTTNQDDVDAYDHITINQTIYVRLAGNKLWYDFTTLQQNQCCCCVGCSP
jgi:hypothetical protein